MKQNKHLLCLKHQGEMYIHYCRDCFFPLCPECLHQHTQIHKSKQSFPDIISLKTLSQQCQEKLQLKQINLRTDIQNVEYQIEQFHNVHELSIQTLHTIKQQLTSHIEHLFAILAQQLSINFNDIQQQIKLHFSPYLKNLQIIDSKITQSKSTLYVQHPAFLDAVAFTLKMDDQCYNETKDDFKRLIANLSSQQTVINNEEYSVKVNQFHTNLQRLFNQKPQDLQHFQSFSDQKENLNHSIACSTNCKKAQVSTTQSVGAKQRLFFSSLNQLELKQPNYFVSDRRWLHFFQSGSNLFHYFDLETEEFEIVELRPANGGQLLTKEFKVVPYFHQSLMTPEGTVYIVGGSLEDGSKLRGLYQLEPLQGELSEVANMNIGRSSFGICYQAGCIYVVGGYISGLQITSSCERFFDGKWERIANLNEGCANVSVCSYQQEFIFKFGGRNEKQLICSQIERYSAKRNVWEQISLQDYGKLSQFRCMSGSVQINSTDILIIGGYDAQNEGTDDTLLFSDLGSERYLLQEVEEKVPFKEGFWNGCGIIHEGRMFILQNVSGESKENCEEGERSVLLFDGDWKRL